MPPGMFMTPISTHTHTHTHTHIDIYTHTLSSLNGILKENNILQLKYLIDNVITQSRYCILLIKL